MFGIRIRALILAAAMALPLGAKNVINRYDPASVSFQRAAQIHPLTEDNISPTGSGYIIRDWETGDEYVLDANTLADPDHDGDIPGYAGDVTALEWFEEYLSQPIDSGLGFGMGDIFDVLVTDEHIDILKGVYWWD